MITVCYPIPAQTLAEQCVCALAQTLGGLQWQHQQGGRIVYRQNEAWHFTSHTQPATVPVLLYLTHLCQLFLAAASLSGCLNTGQRARKESDIDCWYHADNRLLSLSLLSSAQCQNKTPIDQLTTEAQQHSALTLPGMSLFHKYLWSLLYNPMIHLNCLVFNMQHHW